MKSLQALCDRSPSPAGKSPCKEMVRIRSASSLFLRAAFLVVLASSSAPSWGESLGRLFFTPDERANLDRARLAGGNIEQQDQEQESAPALQVESLTLNGIVKRSSGKTTVWVNHAVQNESDFPSGTKTQVSKSRQADFPVLVQKTGKTTTLKVGQTLNVDNGEIRESYQPSAIKVQPPASSAAAETSATQVGETGKVNKG